MKSSTKTLVCLSMAAVLLVPAWAADPATSSASPASAATTPADIAKLKAQLDQQQRKSTSCWRRWPHSGRCWIRLESQLRLRIRCSNTLPPPTGLIASTSPMALPPAAPAPVPAAMASPAQAPAAAAAPAESSPLQLKLGNVTIMPVGFMDFTAFWRDKDAASSMGSNFGSVPYNNAVQGNLSEFHFSNQNSRIGFRIDGNWKGAHFIGYNEFDFNGTSGSTSLAVSNGAIVPRLGCTGSMSGRARLSSLPDRAGAC